MSLTPLQNRRLLTLRTDRILRQQGWTPEGLAKCHETAARNQADLATRSYGYQKEALLVAAAYEEQRAQEIRSSLPRTSRS